MLARRHEKNVALHGQIELWRVGFLGTEDYPIWGFAVYGIGRVRLDPKGLDGLSGRQSKLAESLIGRVFLICENGIEDTVGATHRCFTTQNPLLVDSAADLKKR